jgi:hypothetical protein
MRKPNRDLQKQNYPKEIDAKEKSKRLGMETRGMGQLRHHIALEKQMKSARENGLGQVVLLEFPVEIEIGIEILSQTGIMAVEVEDIRMMMNHTVEDLGPGMIIMEGIGKCLITIDDNEILTMMNTTDMDGTSSTTLDAMRGEIREDGITPMLVGTNLLIPVEVVLLHLFTTPIPTLVKF